MENGRRDDNRFICMIYCLEFVLSDYLEVEGRLGK